MREFTLKIELGNAEMEDGTDLAGALRTVAGRIDGIAAHNVADHPGTIRDANGNTVGTYEVIGGEGIADGEALDEIAAFLNDPDPQDDVRSAVGGWIVATGRELDDEADDGAAATAGLR